MEINEMRQFFEEFKTLSHDEIGKALNFVTGFALIANNAEFVRDLLHSDKAFDDLYSEFTELVKDTEAIDTEKALAMLDDYKDTLKKAHTFYKYKKEASNLSSPFDFMSMAVRGDSAGGAIFPIMLMLMGTQFGFGRSECCGEPPKETSAVIG